MKYQEQYFVQFNSKSFVQEVMEVATVAAEEKGGDVEKILGEEEVTN
jgi:hypothetical protein